MVCSKQVCGEDRDSDGMVTSGMESMKRGGGGGSKLKLNILRVGHGSLSAQTKKISPPLPK